MILFYYFFFLFPFLILSKDILSYNISYNKQIEEDLFLKLKDIRYPLYKQQKQQQKESNKEDNWKEGIPINIINELILYLKSNFNWKNQINKLNSFNQFQLEIENYQIHFIHYKSSYKNAKPLLFLHGWPGSFWECHKILPMLTEPQNYGGKIENSFHVICPSIPGYGYSSIPTENGFDQYKCAQIFSKLMLELNYSKYYIQGGDWGSVIGSLQASLPENYDRILGLHLNMVPVAFPFKKGFFPLISNLFSLILPWFFYTPYERQIITDLPLKTILETGYFHEQSTKPLTLSYGLSDSPVGLLAWIVEKFYVWSDVSTKDFFEVHSKDELLTNFMIYWTTNTAFSSVRFYYEMWNNGPINVFERLLTLHVPVPTGVAVFPKEIIPPIRRWAEAYYTNIVQWNHMPSGGHFAALEEPVLLVNEIWKFKEVVEKINEQKKDL